MQKKYCTKITSSEEELPSIEQDILNAYADFEEEKFRISLKSGSTITCKAEFMEKITSKNFIEILKISQLLEKKGLLAKSDKPLLMDFNITEKGLQWAE